MNRTIASIVTYNPDINRLFENINACSKQVSKIVIVDNGSKNNDAICELVSRYDCIEFIELGENNGIAYALNEAVKYSSKKGFNWLLTLDQDSVIKESLITNYEKYIHVPNVSMITCNIFDRNFGYDIDHNDSHEYVEVDQCITSGNYININYIISVDGFDDSMFIDYVDFDICRKVIDHGYKIIRINFEGLLHEVGDSKKIARGKRQVIVYNHIPLRHYYQARNRVYYLRKFHKSITWKNTVKLIKIHLDKMRIILCYEEQKGKKILLYLKGIIAGLRTPIIRGSYKNHEN